MLEEVLKKATIVDVLIIFIAAIAIIGIWRGIWNLLDEYFLVNNFLWSQIITIIVGLIILIIISRLK